MIVAAAIKYAHLTFSMPQPARHHDVLHQLYHALEDVDGPKHEPIARFQAQCEQGFLTDKGEFLGRRGAYHHARDCGQGTPRRDALAKANPSRQHYGGDELFSEDIW